MRESANYYGTIQKSIGLRMRAKHVCLYLDVISYIISRRFFMLLTIKTPYTCMEFQVTSMQARQLIDEALILCQEKVQIKNDFFPSCQHT